MLRKCNYLLLEIRKTSKLQNQHDSFQQSNLEKIWMIMKGEETLLQTDNCQNCGQHLEPVVQSITEDGIDKQFITNKCVNPECSSCCIQCLEAKITS